MRAAIYCRVSSEKQRENTSLEYQREQCTAYAAAHGFEVVATLSDIESGDSSTRAGFLQLSDLVASRSIDAVIALRVDRLSRNTVHYGLLVNDMITLGIELHYTERGRVNLDDEIRIDEFEILLAQGERKRILKRFMQGKQARINAGQFLGHGIAPYGYYFTGEKRSKAIHIDEEEAQIVRDIFSWCVNERLSTGKIAARLSAMHVPTPEESKNRTGRPRKRATGQWQACAIQRILHNPVYKGEFVNGRSAVDYTKPKNSDGSRPRKSKPGVVVHVPALITPELWQAAQEQLERSARGSRRNVKHFYLLRGGMLKCVCGYTITGMGRVRNKAQQVERRYACQGKKGSAEILHKCSQPSYKAEKLESLAWVWVQRVLTPEALRSAIQEQRERDDSKQDRVTRQIRQVEIRRAQLDDQRQRDRADYHDGLLTRDEMKRSTEHYEQVTAEIDTELARLHDDLRSSSGDTTGLEALYSQIAELQAMIASATPEEQRALLETLDFQMVVGNGYADVSCLLASDRLQLIGDAPSVACIHNTTLTLSERLVIE